MRGRRISASHQRHSAPETGPLHLAFRGGLYYCPELSTWHKVSLVPIGGTPCPVNPVRIFKGASWLRRSHTLGPLPQLAPQLGRETSARGPLSSYPASIRAQRGQRAFLHGATIIGSEEPRDMRLSELIGPAGKQSESPIVSSVGAWKGQF